LRFFVEIILPAINIRELELELTIICWVLVVLLPLLLLKTFKHVLSLSIKEVPYDLTHRVVKTRERGQTTTIPTVRQNY
jgi:uncharacterized protein HemY